MKKSLSVLLVVIFLAPAIMNAQFKLAVGPVGGMNINFHTGDLNGQTWNGVGLYFGGQVDMDFSKTVGMVGNMLFVDNRYASTSVNGTTVGASFSYFSIDALLKLKLINSGLYFLAGPAIGFNTAAKAYVGSNSGTINNTNMMFSLKGGMGYNFNIGKTMAISPIVMFGYSFTDFVKDVDWKVFTISAGCALKFNLI